MSESNDGLVLDRLIHEPARLAIMTVLSSVKSADFLFLQRATRLTKGNLSSHLTKLEEAGLVEIQKKFVMKKPNTNVALTAKGTTGIANHWQQLERLKNLSEPSTPSNGSPSVSSPSQPRRATPQG